MGFWDLFKNVTEEEELDDITGLPKHLIEREEEAFIKRKLYQEGKLHKKETKEDKKEKEKKICYECGFPYEIDNTLEHDDDNDLFFHLIHDDSYIDGLAGHGFYSFLYDDDRCFGLSCMFNDSSDDIF